MSQNFKTSEFDCHDGTPYPEKWVESRLNPLCEDLEIIRAEFGGRRVKVLSGHRTPQYNRKIGGARNSQHMEGRASDIEIEGVPPRKVAAKVIEMAKAGRLKHIRGIGSYKTFTHVDIRLSGGLVVWKQ